MYKSHLSRIRDGLSNVHTLSNLSYWIEQKTRLEGKLFSFKDHEYQRDVIDDPAKTVLVNKIAQAGLSEIFARWAVAACTTQNDFTTIWTFPTATDASLFSKARLDPIIAAAPEIKRAISSLVNSSELKQFGSNSFCYIRGTVSETGALSVPADLLIHDEFDRSDINNIAAYVSRLQHKPTKMRRMFSTPTAAKYGISLLCETAKRKRQVWTCSCCNHTWLPSYETDIHIPGWDHPKKEITKTTLQHLEWHKAKLLCPKCGREPDSSLKYRSWVVENPQDNYEDVAYYISPFCAPAFMTPSYLVEASTRYNKWSEFVNQGLGLTSEDDKETLTEADILSSFVSYPLDSSELHVLGADMGVTCHITIARMTSEGILLAVYKERVPYYNFKTRRSELCQKFRVLISVHDMFPYTDIVREVTEYDPNAYGAIYEDRISTETYRTKDQEENPEEGRLNVRAVYVNRSVAFDELMQLHKDGKVLVAGSSEVSEEDYVNHLRDMKRVEKFDKFGGIVMRWVKTAGNDHWHHSLLYAYVAARLTTTANGYTTPGAVPLMVRFKRTQA